MRPCATARGSFRGANWRIKERRKDVFEARGCGRKIYCGVECKSNHELIRRSACVWAQAALRLASGLKPLMPLASGGSVAAGRLAPT